MPQNIRTLPGLDQCWTQHPNLYHVFRVSEQ